MKNKKLVCFIGVMLSASLCTLIQMQTLIVVAQPEVNEAKYHLNLFASQFDTCDKKSYYLHHALEFSNNTKENTLDNQQFGTAWLGDAVQKDFDEQCLKPIGHGNMPSDLDYVNYLKNLNCTDLKKWIDNDYPNVSDAQFEYRSKCLQ